jgi:hypothetical protein
MLTGIFTFFTSLLKKFVDLASWFLGVFKQIFIDIWNVVTDMFCWVLDSALSLASSILSAINVPFDPGTYYSMIPAEMANVLGLIGIPQALAMIVAALIIRFTLQLIPFVRLGS